MGKKRNTSGGGAQTNVHGKKFELDTDLKTALEDIGCILKNDKTCNKKNKSQGYNVYVDNICIGKLASQHAFYKSILEANGIDWENHISKKLLPDEAYYSKHNNTLYIIEKKYQKDQGSVDEKLQTCDFKLKEYIKLVKPLGYNVTLIYVLNDFFKQDKYDDVKKYIKDCNCDYFFNIGHVISIIIQE